MVHSLRLHDRLIILHRKALPGRRAMHTCDYMFLLEIHDIVIVSALCLLAFGPHAYESLALAGSFRSFFFSVVTPNE